MAEVIQEFVDSRDQTLRHDRAAGVLRGVKLLGLRSRNGREYREDALRRAMPLYEGARVNVNHPAGDPLAPRDYRDRLGVIRGVELRTGEGLFGALHFNPKHTLAEQLVWDAEHAPQNVGLSHNVLARTSQHEGRTVVEAIEHVQSVDLVADPATTSGLFEQQQSHAPDEGADDQPPTTPERLSERVQELLEQVESLTAAAAEARHAALVYRLLAEHSLRPAAEPGQEPGVVSEAFVHALLSASDPAAVEQLVIDRARLMQEATRESFGPMTLAREQQLLGQPAAESLTTSEFVRAIARQL